MQIIYQNAQEENVHLLLPMIELFDQNKMPLFNKNRDGRIYVDFGNCITWVLIIQKLWISSQNVQWIIIYKFMSFEGILDAMLVLFNKNS